MEAYLEEHLPALRAALAGQNATLIVNHIYSAARTVMPDKFAGSPTSTKKTSPFKLYCLIDINSPDLAVLSRRFHLQKCDIGRIFPAWLPPPPPPPYLRHFSNVASTPKAQNVAFSANPGPPPLNATYVAFL